MDDIFSYLKWRGDLTFEEVAFNEVDALVFAALIYEEFDEVYNPLQNYNLKQLSTIFFNKYSLDYLDKRVSFNKDSYRLLQACANSKRYQDCLLINYVNEIDRNNNLQFCAGIFSYKNLFSYIAFRGTDSTIVGWKEDFMMFYCDETESEKKACIYLNNVLNNSQLLHLFKDQDYYVGGHSKGGHLAIYASSKLTNKKLKNLKRIYNFDGPGLNKWDNPLIVNKISSYGVEASIFGRLFTHLEPIKIIKSNDNGLFQHALYTWHINPHGLDEGIAFNQASNECKEQIDSIQNAHNYEELEQIVISIFAVFEKLNINTLTDLRHLNLNSLIKGIQEIKNLDSKTKKVCANIIMMIINLSIKH